MERLSGLDASFLYLETPSNHMHVVATMIFDPSTVPGGYSFARVREMIEGRLHLLPPFRRRLVNVPFNLHHPIWVEDPHFDLDYHLRRIGVPSPGGPEELAEIAAEVASHQLDRNRPLWEIWIVEGLEHGHIGTVTKMHHCTVDGVSGANMMTQLFDLEPEADDKPAPEENWEAEHVPSDVELVAHALRSRAQKPFQMAGMVPRTLGAAVNVVRARRRSDVTSAAPLTAPRTSLNQAVTGRLKCAFTRVSLDEVKGVKNAFGTTVNDVVLAVCAGALRRYLLAHDDLPDKSLLAVVPVSVRSDEEKEVVGSNKVSAMFSSLATDVDDPVERLYAIREYTKGANEEHKAIGAEMLQGWTEFAAPTTFSLAARLYTGLRLAERHPTIHNLVISNVPGPPFPLYFAGSRLVALYPLGPVMDGAALNITAVSYMDAIDFGFMACADVLPDVWDLVPAISDSLEELKKAADGT